GLRGPVRQSVRRASPPRPGVRVGTASGRLPGRHARFLRRTGPAIVRRAGSGGLIVRSPQSGEELLGTVNDHRSPHPRLQHLRIGAPDDPLPNLRRDLQTTGLQHRQQRHRLTLGATLGTALRTAFGAAFGLSFFAALFDPVGQVLAGDALVVVAGGDHDLPYVPGCPRASRDRRSARPDGVRHLLIATGHSSTQAKSSSARSTVTARRTLVSTTSGSVHPVIRSRTSAETSRPRASSTANSATASPSARPSAR